MGDTGPRAGEVEEVSGSGRKRMLSRQAEGWPLTGHGKM